MEIAVFLFCHLPASFLKWKIVVFYELLIYPGCLGVTKGKMSYSEINSGCDFHENVEELHKTYLIVIYLWNYLQLGYRAVLGRVHLINTLYKLKHLEKPFMSRRSLSLRSFDNKKFTTKQSL